jgi:hypothetical protein
MLLNPESISILYEVALQDLALSPQDDKGMTDKILRDEARQPNTQTWNTEIYLRTGTTVLGIRDILVRILILGSVPLTKTYGSYGSGC